MEEFINKNFELIQCEDGVVTIGNSKMKVSEITVDLLDSLIKKNEISVDWKALSHSVRVLFEVEELLDTGFVTFPLKEREFVKEVKDGKQPVDVVMMFVNNKLDQVKQKLDDNTTLPETSDRDTMDWLELCFLEWYGYEQEEGE